MVLSIMLVYKKSDKFLTIGMVYSVIVGLCIIAFGVFIVYIVKNNSQGTMDPITTLFFGLAYLFVALIGVLIAVLGAISFVSLAFAIISTKTHKRINYKLCKIFSAVSLNPFSLIGAKMGLNICHDLKEAEKFLNED